MSGGEKGFMGITYRKAERRDVPVLLGFIKDLAEFHGNPGAVTVTAAELERDGFGERPVFEALLAEDDGQAVGMAFYYFSYSTWKGACVHLEDIIIKKNYRGRGIGKALMGIVGRRVLEINGRRLQWQVYSRNTGAIEFYKGLGAEIGDEWVNCRLIDEQIREIIPPASPVN